MHFLLPAAHAYRRTVQNEGLANLFNICFPRIDLGGKRIAFNRNGSNIKSIQRLNFSAHAGCRSISSGNSGS